MTDQTKFAPFRAFDDFIGKAENYAIPDIKDVEKLSNRITNNLLYYQSNYFLVFSAIFVVISLIHPAQFITGLVVFAIYFVLIVVYSKKFEKIERLKKDKPYINLIIILIISCFLFYLFGSMLIFLFSICFPMTIIFIHAGLRLRNLKNKIENKKELIGVTRTPMGILLQSLGATNEIAS